MGTNISDPSSSNDNEFRETIIEAERILEKKQSHMKISMRKITRLRIKLAKTGTEAEELLLQDGDEKSARFELRKEYSIKHEIIENQQLVQQLESSIEEIEAKTKTDILSTRSKEEKLDKYHEYMSHLEDEFRCDKNDDDDDDQMSLSDSSADKDEEEEEEKMEDSNEEEEEKKRIQKFVNYYVNERIKMMKKRSSSSSSNSSSTSTKTSSSRKKTNNKIPRKKEEEEKVDNSSLVTTEVREAWLTVHKNDKIGKSPGSEELSNIWDDLLD